jgi:hypothetical protein
MNDRRFDLPDDEVLAKEIEQALAVEPSPEFLARVRTRVAADKGSRIDLRLLRWLLAGGAGLAAAGVVATLYVGSTRSAGDRPAGSAPEIVRTAPVSPGGGDGQLPKHVVAPAVVERDTRSDDGTRRSMPATARVDAVPAARDIFPEVMVSSSEVEGYRQLLALSRTGIRIAEAPAAASGEDVEKVKEIVIEPIVIKPFELARLEGVTE